MFTGNPNSAAPLIHPLENLFSMKQTIKVVFPRRTITNAKGLQFADRRNQLYCCLTLLLFFESAPEPVMEGANQVSLKVCDLATLPIQPFECL